MLGQENVGLQEAQSGRIRRSENCTPGTCSKDGKCIVLGESEKLAESLNSRWRMVQQPHVD